MYRKTVAEFREALLYTGMVDDIIFNDQVLCELGDIANKDSSPKG